MRGEKSKSKRKKMKRKDVSNKRVSRRAHTVRRQDKQKHKREGRVREQERSNCYDPGENRRVKESMLRRQRKEGTVTVQRKEKKSK